MTKYFLRFPRGLMIDVDNPPEDFEQQIAQNFKEYTYETRIEYRYQDKLAWIDALRDKVNHANRYDTNEAVKTLMKEQFAFSLDEYDEIKEPAYYSGIEFAEYCYEAGFETADKGLYSNMRGHTSHQNERILKLMARAIKVVMNYPETKEDENG